MEKSLEKKKRYKGTKSPLLIESSFFENETMMIKTKIKVKIGI